MSRDRRHRRGFTLLEVTITLALIALVGAIVYQTSSGAATDARAAAARLATSRVLVAQQNYAATAGGYTTNLDALDGIGRDIGVTTTGSTGPTQVSVAVSSDDSLVLAALGADGRCYVTVAGSLLDGGRVTDSVESGLCAAAAHLPPGESIASP